MDAKQSGKQEPEDPLGTWRGRGRLPVGEAVDDYLQRIREGPRNSPDLYPKMPRVLPRGTAARLLDEERGER